MLTGCKLGLISCWNCCSRRSWLSKAWGYCSTPSTDSCLQICEIALSFCSGSTTAHMYTCLNALCFAEMVVCIHNVRKVILTEQKFLVICHCLLNENLYLRGHWSQWAFEDCLKVQHIKTQRYQKWCVKNLLSLLVSTALLNILKAEFWYYEPLWFEQCLRVNIVL